MEPERERETIVNNQGGGGRGPVAAILAAVVVVLLLLVFFGTDWFGGSDPSNVTLEAPETTNGTTVDPDAPAEAPEAPASPDPDTQTGTTD